jgi:hypothetical protein
MAQDVIFDQSIPYYQLLRSPPTKLMLAPPSELLSSEPVLPVEPPQQLLKDQPLPSNPIDHSDHDLSPSSDYPAPDPMLNELQSDLKSTALATSSRNESGTRTFRMATIVEPEPTTYSAALNSEDADH